MIWKILGKEFSGNRSKVFLLKLIILAFHLDDLKVLNERLDKDGCGGNQRRKRAQGEKDGETVKNGNGSLLFKWKGSPALNEGYPTAESTWHPKLKYRKE